MPAFEMTSEFSIVLVRPEIPHNTGAIFSTLRYDEADREYARMREILRPFIDADLI